MYLRAASSAERQQWLVALGTSKACRVDTNYEEQQQQSEFDFIYNCIYFETLFFVVF